MYDTNSISFINEQTFQNIQLKFLNFRSLWIYYITILKSQFYFFESQYFSRRICPLSLYGFLELTSSFHNVWIFRISNRISNMQYHVLSECATNMHPSGFIYFAFLYLNSKLMKWIFVSQFLPGSTFCKTNLFKICAAIYVEWIDFNWEVVLKMVGFIF